VPSYECFLNTGTLMLCMSHRVRGPGIVQIEISILSLDRDMFRLSEVYVLHIGLMRCTRGSREYCKGLRVIIPIAVLNSYNTVQEVICTLLRYCTYSVGKILSRYGYVLLVLGTRYYPVGSSTTQ
jgi:hypothetical protein